MSKDDILAMLASDLNDPGSQKSGEYLEEHVLRQARSAVASDRVGLVEAMRQWLELRREPETMLAVSVAEETELQELAPDIDRLLAEVVAGQVFQPYYADALRTAVARLRD
ncbi:MAG: hypothetical protein J5I93_08175 [Pirellulaceae bacterium]|nr:hypothetical protein [Pirellulaceae bacterium]